MADLAAGKKAAAIKAIDDYVKVQAGWWLCDLALTTCTLVWSLRTTRNLVLAVEAQLCLLWSDWVHDHDGPVCDVCFHGNTFMDGVSWCIPKA